MLVTRPLHVFLRHPANLRSSLVWQCIRDYHSYEHEAPFPFAPTEDAILSAALSHVPTHGFSINALTQGARDAGYLDISTNLFPTGAFSIVRYHLVSQRLALAKHASSLQPQVDITANIATLALHRLHANKPIIHRWQEALALLSTARHLATSIRELALLSDELLFLAGSTTVTSSWYTNRAALAAVYASAELFMTQDTSKGFVETEEFLTRRLEEGEKVRGGLDMFGKWVGMQAGGLVDGLRSKGIWV
ncbi:MAG: Ubiquinone biosynthesis protein coq9, mitochondrial [Alectoria fallacina]|uniref:Ubiquinone biosynthesis protein n=1 Tax=Alectoria fallacina TaxID=1903189 RepID=A0A8H3EI89_9LECA|nr:MAG: Ubiquinone biosynthesis protein coq9, mitochondrial [Alectoria fallacina]